MIYCFNRIKIRREVERKADFMKITLKIAFVFLFFSLLIIQPTPSYAWHGHSRTSVSFNFGVWPDYYYGSPYYYPYYYPYDYPYYHYYYAEPYYYPEPVVVASSSYQPVVVNGATYYVNNGVYYIYTQYGYQAVANPTVASAPVSVDTADSFTINVPNNKGGYTTVVLKRSGNGYIGPQGEYYSEFPKVSQLRLMYGK